MVYKNKAVISALLLCYFLGLKPSFMADVSTRRTRRDVVEVDNYTCSNSGKLSKTYPKGPPIILNQTYYNIEKYVDDHVSITCIVRSNPAAKVKWLFNGSPLFLPNTPQYIHKIHSASCGQTLLISHARSENSGAYTCVVSNGYGTVNQTCNVMVNVPERKYFIINRGIRLIGSSAGNAIIGLPLNMSCEVYNADYVYWTKDGTEYCPHSSSCPRVSNYLEVFGHNRYVEYIIFSHIEEEDRGNYSCVGVNMKYKDKVHSYAYLETAVFSRDPGAASRRSVTSNVKPEVSAISFSLLLVKYVLLN